jgi:hypothetical protein
METINYDAQRIDRLVMPMLGLPDGIDPDDRVNLWAFWSGLELGEVMEAGAKKDGRKGKRNPKTGRRRDGRERTNGGSSSEGRFRRQERLRLEEQRKALKKTTNSN